MKGRLAANPIPYWATAGKTQEVFDQAFADFAASVTPPSKPTCPTA